MSLSSPKIVVRNGIPTTTSNQVADYFGKDHRNVLRDIGTVLNTVSKEFNRLNFEPTTYKDRKNRAQRNFTMTFNSFVMVAMGFTGEKAIKLREEYITRFEEMSKKLAEANTPKPKPKIAPKPAFVQSAPYLPLLDPAAHVRDTVSVGAAMRHIRLMKRLPELTGDRLKGMIRRGEIGGGQDERGRWFIWHDELMRLLGGAR